MLWCWVTDFTWCLCALRTRFHKSLSTQRRWTRSSAGFRLQEALRAPRPGAPLLRLLPSVHGSAPARRGHHRSLGAPGEAVLQLLESRARATREPSCGGREVPQASGR